MAVLSDVTMPTISRRDLFRLSVPLCASLVVWKPAAASVPQSGLTAKLAREFPSSALMAGSPDGTKVCIEDWKEKGYPFRIVEMGTWLTLYTAKLEARA